MDTISIFRQPMNRKRLLGQINRLDVLICHLLSLIRPHRICCKHVSLDYLLWPWLLHQSEQTSADLAKASLQRVLVRGVIAPGEQALHLLEEVVPTPFRMGKDQDKKPLPLSFRGSLRTRLLRASAVAAASWLHRRSGALFPPSGIWTVEM
jgi:hypothetical protein